MSSVPPIHCHFCPEVHSSKKQFQLQEVLETVCRVALTAIAFMTHFASTACGMVAGIGYGLYIGYAEDQKKCQANKEGSHGCAHGFLEDLSGVRFPAAFNTLAAFGITLEHLFHGCEGHHHSPIPFSIFAALAGVSSGAWVGKGLWSLGKTVYLANSGRCNPLS